MKYIILTLTVVFGISLTTAQTTCRNCKAGHHHLKSAFDNLRSDTMNVMNYDIYLDFTNMGSQTIKGYCNIHYKAKLPTAVLCLDLLQLTIDSITNQSGPMSYSYNDTLIVVSLGTILNPNDEDSLTVHYSGSPQTDATGWGGFYFQNNYAYNLGVGFGADPHNYGRVWHPCFDNFAERATYDFTILTNGGRTAYCNGERLTVTPVGTDSLLTKWRMNDPIPSYLASVAVSSYTHAAKTHLSVVTGTNIPIWLIAQAIDTSNMKSSFTNIESAIQTFETSYGPHSWNKIGFVLVPFNSGAMEHATNIAYPRQVANGGTLYETLYAHELAHHWWGDLVTCRTEEEMWINEGMASYSENLFLEGLYGKDRYLKAMRENHHNVLHLAHITDNGFYALNAVPHAYTYGEHSYNKGADVVHSLRGYLGDSLFFEGLKSVIIQFAGGNVSSSEFMDQMNTVLGIDVTNFFNDWIFSPGFSHFSVKTFSSTGSSGSYNVEVVVDQRLKGTSSNHSNVPLQLTFKDAAWNTVTEEITMNGPYQVFTFQLPIDPVFVGINLDERINDATTAVTSVESTTGLKDYSYANCKLTISNITDSVFIRAEHNWVAPGTNNVPPDIVISSERYWNIHGIADASFEGTLRFDYNGQTNNAGYYDNQLLVDLGSQPFKEDSIVLLYRPDATSSWQVHPNYNLSFQGSNLDKKGTAITGNFQFGQYTWGYRTSSVGLNEVRQKKINLYPNPAREELIIETAGLGKRYEIFDLHGRIVKNGPIRSERVRIETRDLKSGTYVIRIFAGDEQIFNKQFIINN